MSHSAICSFVRVSAAFPADSWCAWHAALCANALLVIFEYSFSLGGAKKNIQ
jgi:hypothetical protein